MMDVVDRARAYLDRVPVAVSGSGGHTQCLLAARALVRGFSLSMSDALVAMRDWNARCDPPWSERELVHKINSALTGPAPMEGDGYLLKPSDRGRVAHVATARPYVDMPKVEYDPSALSRFAGEMAGVADLRYLAERSAVDPATVSSSDFLDALYHRAAGERVLVFTSEYSQGDAVWPNDSLPAAGPCGVWYLCQPVDGEYRPTGSVRDGNKVKMSRRAGECLLAWRYLVVESDEAPAREWLGALVQMPLRIAAIYSSGARSLHALVRVDARTKREWDGLKSQLRDALVLLGADPGAMSGVRLTRLPGTLRRGKYVPVLDDAGNPVMGEHGRPKMRYVRWDVPGEQKLLYLQPSPSAMAISDLPRRRDIVADWTSRAVAVGRKGDVDGLRVVVAACDYYRRVCPELAGLRLDAESVIDQILTAGACPRPNGIKQDG